MEKKPGFLKPLLLLLSADFSGGSSSWPSPRSRDNKLVLGSTQQPSVKVAVIDSIQTAPAAVQHRYTYSFSCRRPEKMIELTWEDVLLWAASPAPLDHTWLNVTKALDASATCLHERSCACECVHPCSRPALWSAQPLQLLPVWVTFLGRALEQSSCLLQLLFQPPPPPTTHATTVTFLHLLPTPPSPTSTLITPTA